jgi:hypothetical protein
MEHEQASTTDETSAGELNRRIQSLPQELFDMIYDFTFTAVATVPRITIDEHYRPPALLRVDPIPRRAFAKVCYGLNELHPDFDDILDDKVMKAWLRSIPKEHRVYVRKIRHSLDLVYSKHLWLPLRLNIRHDIEQYLRLQLDVFGIPSLRDALIVECRLDHDG